VGVFLSHAHADKPFASKLGNDLICRGIRVWIDSAEIKVGDSLLSKIADGLETMDYLAVVLSGASVRSEWVRREVEIAMNREIDGKRVTVLPLLYRDCEIPSFLKGKMYADFREERSYGESLEALLDRFRRVSPLQGLLRASLPGFVLHGILLDASTLIALASDEVTVGELESELVVESVAALFKADADFIYEWDDWNQGGEIINDPPQITSRMQRDAQVLKWVSAAGLKDRIDGVLQRRKKTSS